MGTIYGTLEKLHRQFLGQEGIYAMGIGKGVIHINTSLELRPELKAMIESAAFPDSVKYVIADPPVPL
jgi:hypothetical protein